MILDLYQTRRILAEFTAPPRDGMKHPWMARPWRLDGWAGATDARRLLLVRYWPNYDAAPIPDGCRGVIERSTDVAGHDFLGEAPLRELASWSEAGPLAGVGPAVFDREELCPALTLLAMAGDCPVRVGVSKGPVSEKAAARSLLLDAGGWRLLLMGCRPEAGWPGDDTRPPLGPLP
jgi:hypothetical protein